MNAGHVNAPNLYLGAKVSKKKTNDQIFLLVFCPFAFF